MKCPRCNSENIQMQVTEGKSLPIIGFVLLFGGIGLMLLSIIGLIIGALIGLLVGSIAKAVLPNKKETVSVCQSCGYTSNPIPQSGFSPISHPLFCSESECNLSVTRENSTTGSAIPCS